MTFNANTSRRTGVTAAALVITVIGCHPSGLSGRWSDLWTEPRTSNCVFPPLPRSGSEIRNHRDHFLADSIFLFRFTHSPQSRVYRIPRSWDHEHATQHLSEGCASGPPPRGLEVPLCIGHVSTAPPPTAISLSSPTSDLFILCSIRPLCFLESLA